MGDGLPELLSICVPVCLTLCLLDFLERSCIPSAIGERIDVIPKPNADRRGARLFLKPSTLLPVLLSPTGGLDLIFMPGLGFDRHGNRLGRGRGYYDAYLKRCLEQQDVRPYTMALAFREQICLQVPVDENDMKVDEVLYEEPSV
ncbi:5-formyltetrahydrofolate cyclo-ligase [Ailuropoda melanoleuca]|uniref:5-formyltetrahydrofolate cyclo-ligase n=1 Tax=Ailuropoda melanoleuca TaxID=9646 RepID=UPI00149443C1|nr:5-formyltetrahydrofolate cyclo-ligase [Ailuropoda melanoleuca]